MPFGPPLVYGLFEDEVFQEALLNPVVQALATYLVGRNAVISEYGLLIKGPGGQELDLHTDSSCTLNGRMRTHSGTSVQHYLQLR